jgi:hypothetical protein
MGHEHRSKIQIPLLINRLHEIGLGKVEGTQVSVNAALGLLRKALPDLQASQISGDAENPITVQTIISPYRGPARGIEGIMPVSMMRAMGAFPIPATHKHAPIG